MRLGEKFTLSMDTSLWLLSSDSLHSVHTVEILSGEREREREREREGGLCDIEMVFQNYIHKFTHVYTRAHTYAGGW